MELVKHYDPAAYARFSSVVLACEQAKVIQDACNMTGLTLSLHEHLCAMCGELSIGSDELFRIPAIRFWMHQLCWLSSTGEGLSSSSYEACLQWCDRVIEIAGAPKPQSEAA